MKVEKIIDIEKLNERVEREEIIEFESDNECLNYFNKYDSQNFKSINEMIEYQDKYGFNISEKRYHIDMDDALDVWREPTEEEQRVITTFTERYIMKYHPDHGYFSHISSEKIDNELWIGFTYTGTPPDGGNHYLLYARINDNDELELANDGLESLYDYAYEAEWSEEDVCYMKYGK